MEKKAILFHSEWATMISALPDVDAGVVVKAFLRHVENGDAGDVSPLHAAIVAMMVEGYTEDMRKYMEMCEKQRRNVQARWNKSVNDGIPNDTVVYGGIPNDTKHTDNDNDNDNDVLTDIKEKRRTNVLQKEKSNRPEERRQVVEAWNSIPNVPSCVSLLEGTDRFKQLNARIEQYGFEKVMEAVGKVARSSFLQGQNNRAWKADFGWFVKPNNFPKVLEGKYDDRQSQGEIPRAVAAVRSMGFAEEDET